MKNPNVYFSEKRGKEYRFNWSRYGDQYLVRLRKNYSLKKLTKNCKDDYETAMVLCDWVHTRWKHSGSNIPKESDPISILEATKRGERFRCVEYSIVLSACLSALGIKARTLGLMMQEVETKKFGAGHVVVEAYIEKYKKWIFLDPQNNASPILNRLPLNGVEFMYALNEKEQQLKFLGLAKRNWKKYKKFIAPYLFYFRIRLDNRIKNVGNKIDKSLILVPLRHKKPRRFQRENKIKRAVYTSSIASFYRNPDS